MAMWCGDDCTDDSCPHVELDREYADVCLLNILEYWIPRHNISCAHSGTGLLLKFNGIVY